MDQNRASVLDIVDRMKQVIGVSKDLELADYLGGARSTLAVWKKRGSIPVNECLRIAVEKNISLDWLMLGRGTPEIDTKRDAVSDAQGEFVHLPLFDMKESANDAEQAGWWQMPRTWLVQEGLPVEDSAIVRVAGSAHAGGIEDGQMVLIDKGERTKDGVYLVIFGGALRIKRIQHMVDGSLRLTSDSECYAPDIVNGETPVEAVKIIGHCYASFRRVR